MSHLTPEQFNHLKQELLKEQADLQRRLKRSDQYGLADSLRETTGELSAIDNHPADVATEMYERGKDISLLEHHEIELERIDTVLKLMEKGTYGICVVCGKPIPYERLEAIPSTMYCIEDCPDKNMSHLRPVEEEFLDPPFGRTSLDEHEDQNGFDGEDAWQIVEAWGTSDTPAMHEESDLDSYDQIMIEASEELDGCVEAFESFVATDMTGRHVSVVRNHQYSRYMDTGEGVPLLEPDSRYDDLEAE